MNCPSVISATYKVAQEGDTIVLHGRLENRVALAVILTMVGCLGPVSFAATGEPLYLLFALLGTLLAGIGILNVFTRVTWRVGPGSIVLRQQFPWGRTETDYSQAQLKSHYSGRSSQLYLIPPGQSIGPTSTRLVTVIGHDDSVGQWLAGVTGLATLR